MTPENTRSSKTESLEEISNRIMHKISTSAASDQTKEKNCVDCLKPFTVPVYGVSSYEIRCAECLKGKDDKVAAMVAEASEREWAKKCPAHFQETQIDKLPCQEEVRRALDWKYGNIGLLLHGPTGTGKSRTAWLVLRNMHTKRRQFMVLNSLAGLDYASRYSQSAEVVGRWVNELIETDVLFMDDVFKNKFTDSFEGVVFSIVDRRTENGKPIILTANDTGDTLSGRMTEDRGEPLVRRLREFCLALKFKST